MRKVIIVVLILALALTGVVTAGNAFGKNKNYQSMGEGQANEYSCDYDMHGLVNETGYDVYKMEVETGVCESGYAWVSCYGDVFFECTAVDLVV